MLDKQDLFLYIYRQKTANGSQTQISKQPRSPSVVLQFGNRSETQSEVQFDLTPKAVHKLNLLSLNQIEGVSQILAISGIHMHYQQIIFGRKSIHE